MKIAVLVASLLLIGCQQPNPDFPIGTKVKHKTGGPVMIVVKSSGPYVTCNWYDENATIFESNNKIRTGVYYAAELEKQR